MAQSEDLASLKNAIEIELLLGLTGALCGTLVGILFDRLISGMIVGLSSGLFLGMMTHGLDAGEAFVRHFVLRFVLNWNGYIPFNYAPFLDYCVDRIFLRKVGGGYTFVHGLLQDHFASLYQEQGDTA